MGRVLKIAFLGILNLFALHEAKSLGRKASQGQAAEGTGYRYSHALSKTGFSGNLHTGTRQAPKSPPTSGSTQESGWRKLFSASGNAKASNSDSRSGGVSPFKALGFNGSPGTIYFDVDGSNYCKAGTLYWHDKNKGWMGCRALNRATGYSVGAKRDLGRTHNGRMSDGTPCEYRFGGADRSRIQGGSLPEGFSSPIHGKASAERWGPTSAYSLNSKLLIHGRATLGESPSLSTLEKSGGASGCVVTSDSCMRSMNNSGTSQKVFRVQ